MSEEERKQQPNELARGIDSEGFFNLRIHTSQGLEKILGCLFTSMDLIKAFYIEQHQKQKQATLVKPNGVLERFKNRWQ